MQLKNWLLSGKFTSNEECGKFLEATLKTTRTVLTRRQKSSFFQIRSLNMNAAAKF